MVQMRTDLVPEHRVLIIGSVVPETHLLPHEYSVRWAQVRHVVTRSERLKNNVGGVVAACTGHFSAGMRASSTK